MITKWTTADDLGILAFATKRGALARHPSARAIRCEFTLGFLGWLAVDQHGTENGGTVYTPDGRQIPVVSGWTAEHGHLIGMRGASVRQRYADAWHEIMVRVIDAGLTLHEYKRNGGG